MPDKKGRFTDQEETFVKVVSETGNPRAAARAAKYKSPGAAFALAARPAIQAAIRDRELAIIHNELLPIANKTLRYALENGAVPWGAKMKAVEIVHKRVFGDVDDGKGKTAAEMTPEELSATLDRLKSELADRARPAVIEAEAIDEKPQDPGVFD